METFSAQQMVRFGWETFKSRKQFFVAVTAMWMLVSFIIDLVDKAFPKAPSEGALLWAAGTIMLGVASALQNMGIISLMLTAHDAPQEAKSEMLWHPQHFWRYVGTALATGVVVAAGFVALIVPGIILALALSFATMIVIDRGLMPIEAMKESVHITKGHRLQLLLLFVMLVGINIIGAIALLVGLLVSIPVSYLAFVHAYRTLAAAAAPAASAEASA